MTEEKLISELKQGVTRRVYYLHGKETFLVETYAAKIAEKVLAGETADNFNFVKFTGNPNISALGDSVESVSMFSDKKVVTLNDLDAEKADAAYLQELLQIVSNVPDGTCLIIYLTGFVPDVKKVKTKKLITCIEGMGANGTAVYFDKMNEAKTADLIMRRAKRLGCDISRNNAAFLSGLCLRNLTMLSCEIDKLCAYAGYTGEITKKSIETLTARQLESDVFKLAGEITAKRGRNALLLLDELVELGNPPVVIISTLSMTFIDFYRAKLGMMSGKSAAQITADFKYAPNRSWVMGKALTAASRLSIQKARKCVQTLCDADFKLKSSPVSDRIIMEKAVTELLTLC